ncbi:MAG: triose-phosphate isomerase [Firmicutes bacterium]|nr:triose-phosphate isomerase [Bacillota bacterium]
MNRIPFIAGNWKMNMSCSSAERFAQELKSMPQREGVRTAIAAPFTQLAVLKQALADTDIAVFAQNMHFEDSGAYTGEISAAMLKELGVDGVIIGHSERRQYFAETDETVLRKTIKAIEEGLTPIVCVGEGLAQREKGLHFETVGIQVSNVFCGLSVDQAKQVVVAYEPVWAIGTGKTATPQQAQEMCGFIRGVIEGVQGQEVSFGTVIQYGGSVKPDNIAELMAQGDIDGALVGGASLKAADFAAILNY